MVVSSQLTALNEYCSIIMTLTLTLSDMSQLATMKNLYLRTIIARVFFWGHGKNDCLVMLTSLKDEKESEISFDY